MIDHSFVHVLRLSLTTWLLQSFVVPRPSKMSSLTPTIRPFAMVSLSTRAIISLRPCLACPRTFAWTTALQSGHNKWSKVKHQKKGTDAKKTAARSEFATTIAMLSRLYGADLNVNSKLANTVAEAKKGGFGYGPRAARSSNQASRARTPGWEKTDWI